MLLFPQYVTKARQFFGQDHFDFFSYKYDFAFLISTFT